MAELSDGPAAAPRQLPDFTSVDRRPVEQPVKPVDHHRARRAGPILLGASDGAPFFWSVDAQPNAFLVAVGSSGSGKSELLKVLALEIGERVPVVLIDVHGDLRLPGMRAVQLGPSAGINPLACGGEGAEALRVVLKSAAPGLGHVQEQLLNQLLGETLRQARPDMAELGRQLERRAADPVTRQAARGLHSALYAVFAAPVFSAPPLSMKALLADGGTVDLSQLPRHVQKVAAGALLAQLWFTLREQGPVERPSALRLFLGLDEASILRDSPFVDPLVKEARKFGLGLAVATQEARDLGASLLDNAAAAAVFRVQTATEAKRAARLLPDFDPAKLQRLARGECWWRDAQGLRLVQIAGLRSRQKSIAMDLDP